MFEMDFKGESGRKTKACGSLSFLVLSLFIYLKGL